MFCRKICEWQAKYGLGQPSRGTMGGEDGQWFMSVFMQTGSTQGIMPHKYFPDRMVQWVVVMQLPGWSDAPPPVPHHAMVSRCCLMI